MPQEEPARVALALAQRGYNADRGAVTLLAGAPDTAAALDAVLEAVPEDAGKVTAAHVRAVLGHDAETHGRGPAGPTDPSEHSDAIDARSSPNPSVSGGDNSGGNQQKETVSTPETEGSSGATAVGSGSTATPGSERSADPDDLDAGTATPAPDSPGPSADGPAGGGTATVRNTDTSLRSLEITNDMTGRSTGTGAYEDFVSVFRDRYDRLSKKLKGRVTHRPATSLQQSPGGGEAGMVGMVNDVRSTANGHWLVELEDTTGVFPCLVMKDKPLADLVDELLHDEVIAVEGTLSDDAGILFVDALHFPDVPRTFRPNTADRHVRAALISDVHVGSEEFIADAWSRFADWLHTKEAAAVEYLLIAGDMVEGIGVYPNQDEELSIVDIYDQYEAFAEHLKAVPADIEIVMIPGNHDAVRLAEPQPGFDEELRSIMDVHDARIVSNPSVVTIEGVSVLMYHGVSLDEVIAELPEEKASYEKPHEAMYHLLKKRHVAPQFGGHTRLAPEDRDYLVMDEVPAIFHTGHVHKLGYGMYRNVLAVNSGCWQAQTAFQESVNIDPDHGFAPVVDLDTLELTVYDFN